MEAGAPKKHKELVVSAGFEDAVTTLIYTGRPLRVRKNPYIEDWNENTTKLGTIGPHYFVHYKGWKQTCVIILHIVFEL